MKSKLVKEGKLLDDDVKLIKQQILSRKPYGEVMSFMVSQLGLTTDEAASVYDEIVIECHGAWRNVRQEKS